MSGTAVQERRRVKLVRVVTDEDAAVACLAMLTGRYGSHVLVDECREHVTGPDADSMARAAAELGLHAEPVTAADLLAEVVTDDGAEDLPYGELDDELDRPRPVPVLAGLRDGRWVVLEGPGRGGRWRLVDPVRGRSRVGPADLTGRLTGATVLLRVTPRPEFAELAARRPSAWRSLGRNVAATPRLWRSLGTVFALSLGLAAFGAATPLLTKVVVDDVVPRQLD